MTVENYVRELIHPSPSPDFVGYGCKFCQLYWTNIQNKQRVIWPVDPRYATGMLAALRLLNVIDLKDPPYITYAINEPDGGCILVKVGGVTFDDVEIMNGRIV